MIFVMRRKVSYKLVRAIVQQNLNTTKKRGRKDEIIRNS
ncbi:unnamed protein product [Brugia timori]|uniref:Transposase n=1 Tax=Brugia timori TaxID=42155 RepID=A0A0R3R1B5_9BILA|nr:unnamed protein product [Brugia timori]